MGVALFCYLEQGIILAENSSLYWGEACLKVLVTSPGLFWHLVWVNDFYSSEVSQYCSAFPLCRLNTNKRWFELSLCNVESGHKIQWSSTFIVAIQSDGDTNKYKQSVVLSYNLPENKYTLLVFKILKLVSVSFIVQWCNLLKCFTSWEECRKRM